MNMTAGIVVECSAWLARAMQNCTVTLSSVAASPIAFSQVAAAVKLACVELSSLKVYDSQSCS
jgi:hypothetical protein